MGLCTKKSASAGGKHCNVCGAHVCGVLAMIVVNSSLHQDPSWVADVPVICMDLANVKTRARLSSSHSADTNVLGSLKNRDNCG